jgi:hypothetical protein
MVFVDFKHNRNLVGKAHNTVTLCTTAAAELQYYHGLAAAASAESECGHDLHYVVAIEQNSPLSAAPS